MASTADTIAASKVLSDQVSAALAKILAAQKIATDAAAATNLDVLQETAEQVETDKQTAVDAKDDALQAASEALGSAQAALSAIPAALPASRAAMAALPDTAANVTLLEDGFAGQFKQVNSADYADLIALDTVGGEIKVKANPNLAYLRQRKFGDHFKTSEQGHNLGVTMAVASARMAAMDPNGVAVVEMNMNGTIAALTKGFTKPKNVKLVGLGKDTVINGYGVTNVNDMPNFNIIDSWTPGMVDMGNFSAVKGTNKITFPGGHGLTSADVRKAINIYNHADYSFLAYRWYYKDGEINQIVGVPNANDLLLAYSLENDYAYSATPGSELKCYLMETSKAGMEGFTLDLWGNPFTNGATGSGLRGIRAGRLVDADLMDLHIGGATYWGINVHQCLNVRRENIDAHMRDVLGGSYPQNHYPLLTSASRKITTRNCHATSKWHASSHGGGAEVGDVPNLDCLTEGSTFHTNGTVACTDQHGNAKRTTWRGNRITGGGINLTGFDTTYERNVVDIPATNVQPIVIAEPGGGKMRIVNCEFNWLGDLSASSGFINITALGEGLTEKVNGDPLTKAPANTGIKRDLIFEMKNTKCVMPNEKRFMRASNYSNTYAMDFDVEPTIDAPALTEFCRITRITTISGKFCRIMPKGTWPAVPYAVWTGGFLPGTWEFPDQFGTDAYTLIGGAVSEATLLTNFPRAYPAGALPLVNPFPGGVYAGGVGFVVEPFAPVVSSRRFWIRSRDSAVNLVAGSISVGWVARCKKE